MRTTILIAFVLYALPVSAQAPAGDPGKGKALYETYTCYACHGFTGETGARVLAESRSANLASEAAFMTYLRARANVAPPQPSTSMPNYSAQTLPDAQAKDLYAYIKTFKSHAPAIDQIPVFERILKEAQKPYKP